MGNLPARDAAIWSGPRWRSQLATTCPIRRQNLSEIDVDTDLVRSRLRQERLREPVHPGKRTKNGEDIELELPKQSVALIDLYLTKHRNQLIEPSTAGRVPAIRSPGRTVARRKGGT